MNRHRIIQVLKWIVSIGILWALLSSFDTSMLSSSFVEANVLLLLLALVIGFVSIIVSIVRWRISLAVQGIQAPLGKLLSSTLISGFLGFLLPAFGEDAVRGYDFYKSNSKGVNIAASILFERICGLLGQVIVGGIALSLCHHRIADRGIVHWACFIYGCVIFALVVVFNERFSFGVASVLSRIPRLQPIANKVNELTAAIQLYRGNWVAWARVLAMSLVFQFCGFVYFFVIAKALHVDVPFSVFVMLVPIVTILSLVPISIGGLGVKEGLFVFLFRQLGVAAESAFLISAVGSSLYLVWVVVGGIVFASRKFPQKSKSDCPA